MKKIGVIDIGTNSVRLMLATRAENGEVESLFKTIRTVRTGQGVNETKRLHPDAIERTVGAVSELCTIAREWSTEVQIAAFATSAVRDARNKQELIDQIEVNCGVKLDVLSGEDEAQTGFAGAIPPGKSGGIIDIGGGSTEVIFGRAGKIEYAKSFNIGCVRALDIFGKQPDLEAVQMWAKEAFLEIKPLDDKDMLFYTIGGTATSIAAICLEMEEYDASKINHFILTKPMVSEKMRFIWSLDIEERKKLTGMEEKRADIIGFGITILDTIMEEMKLEQVIVSDADNLEGYAKIKMGECS